MDAQPQGRMSSDKRPREVCLLAHEVDADRIAFESNYGGDMADSLIRQVYGRTLSTVQRQWMVRDEWPTPIGKRGRWNAYDPAAVDDEDGPRPVNDREARSDHRAEPGLNSAAALALSAMSEGRWATMFLREEISSLRRIVDIWASTVLADFPR